MLLGAAALIAAALLLPFAVNVNRFRGQIVGALEAGLGRPVQAGNIRLKLLPWPGFDLENVSIGEVPAFGNEPFARMPVLHARLRLRSLWTGRMVFSSLVFVEPSVNLARNAEGRWAIERLLARAAAASRSLAARPYLELRDARINFKAGDFKSVFFLSDVDAALYPSPGAPPRLLLRLSCSPARTDRTLTDLGQWRAEGSFQPASASRSDVRLQLNLSDTYLGDLQVLASGRDYGIHGLLNARATLEGETTALRLKGAARLADLHRWDLLPPPGNPAVDLDFEALLDGPAGKLHLLRLQTPLGAGKLEATGTVTNLWERPQCDLQTAFSGARAATVLAALQHFSARLSPAAPLDGLLEGELRVQGMPLAVDGFLRGQRLEMRDAAGAVTAAPEVRVEFHGARAVLLPTVVKWEPRGSVTLAGDWDWAGGVGRLAATGGDVPFRGLSGLAALAGLDLAEAAHLQPEGRVSLNLRAEGIGSAPKLAGWVQLTRVPWTPSASAAPVMIHTARLEMAGEQVRATRIVAAWAGATITGALRFPWRLPGVLRADLRADEVNSGLVSGALRPGRRGLLPRLRESAAAEQASSRQPPAPPAQPRLHIEGRLAIDRLRLRRLTMLELVGDFRVAGQRLLLNPARARLAAGAWTGDATLDLSGGTPAIQVHGRVREAALGELAALSPQLEGLAAGRLSGSLVASASGWELLEVLDSLSMRLKLEGEEVLLHSVDFDTAAGATTAAADRLGSFQADLAVERRRVRLQKMVWRSSSSEYSVAGAVSFDRLLDVQVTPLKPPSLNPFRLTGPLEAPVVEPLPAPRRPQ
jgi:hypothetical protein